VQRPGQDRQRENARRSAADFAAEALRLTEPGDLLDRLAVAVARGTGATAVALLEVADDRHVTVLGSEPQHLLEPAGLIRVEDLAAALPGAGRPVDLGPPHGPFLGGLGLATGVAGALEVQGERQRVVCAWWRRRPPPGAGSLLMPFLELGATALNRLRAEEALRQSERRLADAQAMAHLGSYDWDIARDRNEWSDELYRIYGCEPQSFNASYERFLAFVHPDDRERIIATHQSAYQTGSSYSMQERIIRADGAVRILQTSGEVVLGPDGAPARMRGICWDVTERQRAQEESRHGMRVIHSLLDTGPTAALVLDEAGYVLHANGAAADLLEYAVGELRGRSVAELLPDAGLPELIGAAVDSRVAGREAERHCEVRGVAVDVNGEPVVVAFLTGREFRGAAGESMSARAPRRLPAEVVVVPSRESS
jgi:PAS domain S-box-containing protein